ncbi:MAG: trypsin-like peptidase domain-containing protein, partial [Spirochaetales bacterium]|nr:trypsin-like peptidase domain-containing protein [Spirochaetales bacterium]
MKKSPYLICYFLLLCTALSGQEGEESWKQTVEELQRAFRDISREVLPVVVEINVEETIIQELPDPDYWQFFFGNPPEEDRDRTETPTREYSRSGLGSGVLVSQKDDTVYVVTNYHVAGEADKITISLYDGRRFNAELAGVDREGDLALLSFSLAEKVPTAILGDSESLEVGDWVLAVGNPYGFESTVTQGIISATGRYGNFIQTDASINSGNSGGALVNLRGEVIGINTWIATRNGANMGLGFAIPVNRIKEEVDRMINRDNREQGWLGVNSHTATEALKLAMDLHEWTGSCIFNIHG